jgi:hypothetical protein
MTKFTVYYERKVRTIAYEMLTIGWSEEFDSNTIERELAFCQVRDMVEQLIMDERDRIVEKSVLRPRGK